MSNDAYRAGGPAPTIACEGCGTMIDAASAQMNLEGQRVCRPCSSKAAIAQSDLQVKRSPKINGFIIAVVALGLLRLVLKLAFRH